MNKQEVINALDNFRKATFALNEILTQYNDISFSEGYPFTVSFDEIVFEIAEWVDTQKEILTAK